MRRLKRELYESRLPARCTSDVESQSCQLLGLNCITTVIAVNERLNISAACRMIYRARATGFEAEFTSQCIDGHDHCGQSCGADNLSAQKRPFNCRSTKAGGLSNASPTASVSMAPTRLRRALAIETEDFCCRLRLRVKSSLKRA